MGKVIILKGSPQKDGNTDLMVDSSAALRLEGSKSSSSSRRLL